MKNKKRKRIKFLGVITLVLMLLTLINIVLAYCVDVLPLKYFAALGCILFFALLFCVALMNSKKTLNRVVGFLLSVIIIIIELFGIRYELSTIGFFRQFGDNNYKTENYIVLVLKESNYKNIKDLKGLTIGHLKTEYSKGLESAINDLRKKIKFKSTSYDDSHLLLESLFDKKQKAIVLEETQLDILKEENNEDYEKIKILYTIDVDIKIENAVNNDIDILNDSFNVYISGIDTYGSITKVSRSDVNIIASVNPKTNNIVLTSIPRDYYVTLSKYNELDKLTHAGIYGVETSIGTLENLLDIKINYYVKVNFTSLIKVVDALKGIEVDSPRAFTSVDGYHYKKGINKLDGKKALSFVRERKAFADGDRIRGENQQLVLTSIINKATSADIIVKYNELLKAVDGKFITNVEEKDITRFIKNEIKKAKKWNIESIALDGKDSFEYTYSHKRNKLYVMLPNEETVINAKEIIKKTID